jgi:hypothetical protein
MGHRLKKWPSWAERALQDEAFWIGHRQSLYSDYPLSEAAIVTEVCNLIHANLPNEYRLKCEVQYSEFISDSGDGTILTERARVDLVVEDEPEETTSRPHPSFVIEVKRAGAPKAQIDKDLQRLAAVKAAIPSVRAFLFVFSEKSRPSRFVSEEGQSILGKNKVASSKAYYRVGRTWKAAKSYKSKESAHYACLIEVFNR